ncbi:MAG: hypothetical protein M3R38_11810 [Actinomycetota bacterium]|nr:hypothetical protein [Actinomycetota bacterium]
MRSELGVLYWLMVGLLGLFGLYALASGASPSWLLIPAVPALLGAWWPGVRYSGAGLVLFGAYPALLLTGVVLDGIISPMRTCSELTMGGVPRPSGGTYECAPDFASMIPLGLCLWTVAFLGVALLYRQIRYGDA